MLTGGSLLQNSGISRGACKLAYTLYCEKTKRTTLGANWVKLLRYKSLT